MVRIFRALAASWTTHAPPEYDLEDYDAMNGLDATGFVWMRR